VFFDYFAYGGLEIPRKAPAFANSKRSAKVYLAESIRGEDRGLGPILFT
jgi:hypothetical protein